MLQTKYITLDEFEEYFGINLRHELGSVEAAVAFLTRLENRIASYCDSKFNKNIDATYPHFSDYQKKHYKLALLEQAIYVFKNGDISVDSGYDPDKGVIGKPQSLVICENCKNELRLCGIWNRNIGPTVPSGWPFLW